MPQPVGILNNRSGLVDVQPHLPTAVTLAAAAERDKHQQASSGSVRGRRVQSCLLNIKSIQGFRLEGIMKIHTTPPIELWVCEVLIMRRSLTG